MNELTKTALTQTVFRITLAINASMLRLLILEKLYQETKTNCNAPQHLARLAKVYKENMCGFPSSVFKDTQPPHPLVALCTLLCAPMNKEARGIPPAVQQWRGMFKLSTPQSIANLLYGADIFEIILCSGQDEEVLKYLLLCALYNNQIKCRNKARREEFDRLIDHQPIHISAANAVGLKYAQTEIDKQTRQALALYHTVLNPNNEETIKDLVEYMNDVSRPPQPVAPPPPKPVAPPPPKPVEQKTKVVTPVPTLGHNVNPHLNRLITGANKTKSVYLAKIAVFIQDISKQCQYFTKDELFQYIQHNQIKDDVLFGLLAHIDKQLSVQCWADKKDEHRVISLWKIITRQPNVTIPDNIGLACCCTPSLIAFALKTNNAEANISEAESDTTDAEILIDLDPYVKPTDKTTQLISTLAYALRLGEN